MPTSIPEVREQLVHALTLRNNPLTLAGDLLDDFAAIGSFLTDEAACRPYLARLNNALIEPLKAARVIVKRKNAAEGESAFALKTDKHMKDKNASIFRREYFDEQIVKHHKVLTTFFAKWEGDAGFNVGTNQLEGERLPPRPATLTDFVHANDFRNYLLKHGYHWKDAGVGTQHGEFTHRIHWYMVIERFRDSQGKWLNKPPVALFKAMAEPAAINQQYAWNPNLKRVNVWDQVFDNGDNNADLNPGEAMNCPHYAKPNGFRRPENLHRFVQEERNSPDLWALGYLIWGRTNKRRNEGSDVLRQRYQDYIDKNKRLLAVVGFETGNSAPSSGTIIWKG